jgi:uncharacterized protein (DUF2236 family)
MLDASLRRRLGIRFSVLDAAAFAVLGSVSRATEPVMPERLKVMGPAHLRWRRAEIAGGPLGISPTGPEEAAAA